MKPTLFARLRSGRRRPQRLLIGLLLALCVAAWIGGPFFNSERQKTLHRARQAAAAR